MPRVEHRLKVLLCGLVAVCVGLSCGGGPSLPTPPHEVGTLEVRVSAGGPVSGADISVHALVDSTGAVQDGVGSNGVIGTGGPTDGEGKATVQFTAQYSGPIQIVASGSAMSYPDPTVPWRDGQPGAIVPIGSDFVLSSYLGTYTAGTSAVVVVDLLTTLADHGALAYARGLHPSHPGAKALSAALADRDQLFVRHVCPASIWDQGSLRSTIPAPLTSGAQTMADVACAAFADIALNWLARDMGGSGTGDTALTAVTLTRLLEQDLDADGMFDGKGPDGVQLQTSGSPPVSLDAQTLRLPFATALDAFTYTPEVNKSGLTRVDLRNAGVYDTITNDESDLFGAAPTRSFAFDRIPPSVAFATPVPDACNTHLKVQVTAKDTGAGVSAVWVQLNGTEAVQATPAGSPGIFETAPLVLTPGPNTIVAWAVDDAGTSGQGQPSPATATATVKFDNQEPNPDHVRDFASYYDERGLTVATTDGVAVVPARYDCSTAVGGCRKIGITGHDVYKVATRLGWTTEPTAVVLEGANPDNIPVLQWKVPYNSTTDAAITRATYAVAVSCEGCNQAPATGTLWPSATTSTNAVHFDLPIASNLIPVLSSLPGAATLAVTITMSDAAGNVKTTDPINVPFHLLGPPLAIKDAGFGGMGPDASSYQCGGGDNVESSYYKMWSAAPLRLRHYVVSNPHPMSIAFSQPSATWTNHESWKAGRVDRSSFDAATIGFISTGCQTYTGVTCPAPVMGHMPQNVAGCGSGVVVGNSSSAFPADGQWRANTFWPRCTSDESRLSCVASDPGILADWGSFQPGGSVATTTAAYINGAGINPNAAGRYVVPPASSGGPAFVDVYLVLPSISRRPAGFPSPTQENPPFLSPQAYLGNHEGVPTTYAVPVRGVFVRNGRSQCSDGTGEDLFSLHIDYEYLSEAYDDVNGSWSLQTAALNQGFREIGELWTKAAMGINLRIPHKTVWIGGCP